METVIIDGHSFALTPPAFDIPPQKIRIELPFVPPKAVSANARNSRWVTSKVNKKFRALAKAAVEAQWGDKPLPFDLPIRYDVEVYWGKGRLRADTEGVIVMCKAIVDGVADALPTTSDRKMHVGDVIQGRDADNVGWMAIVLSHDEREHGNPVRRMGE
jgi:hypothetical protein